MNVQIDQLVKSLLKKDSIRECSLKELEEFAERHPYFGAAQLLLTKKLQDERSDRYEEQLQKTFTFFNNPLWVQHLLNDTGSAIIQGGVSKVEQNESTPEIHLNGENILHDEINTVETMQETELPAPVPVVTSINEPLREESISIPEEPEVVFDLNPSLNEPKNEIENKQELELKPVEESQPVVERKQAEENPIPKEEMLFEPFHTVDYFASQGIKIKEEEKPVDRFGQQLRSFTDWLKTMKRLPVTEQLAKNVSPALEEKVEQLAAHSLDEKEVVTEAMAAVWEKQGNLEKAREVYRKLSLLDPATFPVRPPPFGF